MSTARWDRAGAAGAEGGDDPDPGSAQDGRRGGGVDRPARLDRGAPSRTRAHPRDRGARRVALAREIRAGERGRRRARRDRASHLRRVGCYRVEARAGRCESRRGAAFRKRARTCGRSAGCAWAGRGRRGKPSLEVVRGVRAVGPKSSVRVCRAGRRVGGSKHRAFPPTPDPLVAHGESYQPMSAQSALDGSRRRAAR